MQALIMPHHRYLSQFHTKIKKSSINKLKIINNLKLKSSATIILRLSLSGIKCSNVGWPQHNVISEFMAATHIPPESKEKPKVHLGGLLAFLAYRIILGTAIRRR